jgi:hypothetical protein
LAWAATGVGCDSLGRGEFGRESLDLELLGREPSGRAIPAGPLSSRLWPLAASPGGWRGQPWPELSPRPRPCPDPPEASPARTEGRLRAGAVEGQPIELAHLGGNRGPAPGLRRQPRQAWLGREAEAERRKPGRRTITAQIIKAGGRNPNARLFRLSEWVKSTFFVDPGPILFLTFQLQQM